MDQKGLYDDIMYLSHPVSLNHPQMSRRDRAAQFSPFAALTGHDAAIKETARITERRIELDEEEKAVLDEKLKIIQSRLSDHPQLRVTYFQADEHKSGGRYLTITGRLKKIESYERNMIMEDGLNIPISDIYDVDG